MISAVSTQRRWVTIGLALVLVLVAVAFVASLGDSRPAAAGPANTPTTEEIVNGTAPIGGELLASLGVVKVEKLDGECYWYHQTEDAGGGYCMDVLGIDNKVDLYVLAKALRGYRMTAEEVGAVEARLREAGELSME
jgi:hypothetical protein